LKPVFLTERRSVWVARYQQFGLAALVRKRRADSGAHRAISARLREVIEGLALQAPPLPIAALSRGIIRFVVEI
jgi:hypothetical protein